MDENSITPEKIRQYFQERQFSPLVFNQSEIDTKPIDNIAVVQAFYGLDPARIAATANALRVMIESTRTPAEWIFIESQKTEKDCCFKWLRDFGINHVFIKSTQKQNGIFLKTPLWNIGAHEAVSSRLCFIDSDIAFCNSGWLEDVARKFDEGFDVVSPHGWSYYENYSEPAGLDESIGHSIENGNEIKHYGFAIAMTKDVYAKIGGFKAAYILDDLDYWTSIVGNQTMSENAIAWKIDKRREYGIDVKVGSTEQVACHCDHGDRHDRKYRQLVDICFGKTTCDDMPIIYDPRNPDILPVWNCLTPFGRIVSGAVIDCRKSGDIEKTGNDWYFDKAEREFGMPDETSPFLAVTCAVKRGYGRVHEDVSRLKDMVDRYAAGFVCFGTSDENTPDGIDVIPYKNCGDLEFLQLFRKDVKFPENSNILFIPQNLKDIEIKRLCQCENGVFAVSENGMLYFRYTKQNIAKIRKMKNIGRNIEEFFYFNGISICPISKYILV